MELISKLVEGFLVLVGTILLVAVFGFLWAYVLMIAWNYVMPVMFGLKTITYWQMWALYVILAPLWKTSITSK